MIQNYPSWLLNDVTWLSAADGLLSDNPDSLAIIQQSCCSLLDGSIQIDQEQISRLTKQRPGPLGRYFETLVQTVISLSPQIKSSHENVIIQDGKRTCGELDLIYQISGQTAGKWVHLELAVKFYLGLDGRADPFHWHGPAARDTLGRKLNRMFSHQLKLPETADGKAALKKLGIDRVHSEALVMGRLFHPYTHWQAGNTHAPEIIAKDHPAGWWLRINQIDLLNDDTETSWQLLKKPEWLAPVDPSNGETINGSDFSGHLKSAPLSRPLMVAALIEGVESHRGFVVPDDWSPKPENNIKLES